MKPRNILLGYLFLQSVQAATLRTCDSSTSGITWSQCNLDFGDEILNRRQKAYDCAKFAVPLDYTNEESSRPLVLDLIKANATRQPRKGSVFYNPGGPGASGVSGVIDVGGKLVDVLGGHYDIISFDPRQTLTATCGGIFDSPLSTLSPRQILNEGADTVTHGDWEWIKGEAWRNADELADACYNDHVDTRRFYGTPFVARHIVKIADALGQGSQINYWGTSYGTVLGQVLAAIFPKRIGRMLLDSNLLADEYFTGTWKSSTKDAEKAIMRFFYECLAAGPQSCSLAANYSTAVSLLEGYNDLQRLYRLDGTLSTTGRPSSKSNWFESLVFHHLYTPSLYPQLGARIKGALEGSETAAFLPFSDAIDSNGASALYIIACGDTSFRADTPDDLFSVYQTHLDQGPFGDTIVLNRFQFARWKFQAAEQIDTNSLRRLETNHPVLIVNGISDPITPLISA
ncbi:tripeptidyl aminopeptidase [Fusarium langsethiae]|uniref:Tripeptidyl aminopeptidase n=1 Tax=Fusarium langsethiae TaxID=179993 RepID=A0A0M9EUS3_FUSLA|nr:tripeptidyl aminopeptidase [Fusarium langsethiae]